MVVGLVVWVEVGGEPEGFDKEDWTPRASSLTSGRGQKKRPFPSYLRNIKVEKKENFDSTKQRE